MSAGGKDYIEFADPVVEQICANKWGDGVGLTYAQAAAVTEIPNNVFRGNTSITSFDEFQYFVNCTTLKGGTSGTGGFQGSSLQSITFPASLTTLGESVFNGCTSLASVTFCPTTALTLNRNVFNGCSALTSISGIKIGTFNSYGCFLGCTSLTSVDLSTSTFTTLISSGSSNTDGVFKNCTSLKTVVLPSGCVTLGKAAFQGCSSLENINLGNIVSVYSYSLSETGLKGSVTFTNATTFQSWALYNSDKLEEVYCPSIVSTAGTSTASSGSFGNCDNLVYAEFGTDCTTLAQRTFHNCAKLKTFVIKATTPPTLGSNAFASNASGRKIYVPYSADHSILNSYKTANVWANIASYIYELNEDGTVPS